MCVGVSVSVWVCWEVGGVKTLVITSISFVGDTARTWQFSAGYDSHCIV